VNPGKTLSSHQEINIFGEAAIAMNEERDSARHGIRDSRMFIEAGGDSAQRIVQRALLVEKTGFPLTCPPRSSRRAALRTSANQQMIVVGAP